MKQKLVLCVKLTLLIMTVACRQNKTDEEKQTEAYIAREISVKLKQAENILSVSSGTPLDPGRFDTNIQNIILVSKDVENIAASASMANHFFADLARSYRFNTSDFIQINTLMHVNEIERAVRQNELTFLNLYLLKYAPDRISLGTAH